MTLRARRRRRWGIGLIAFGAIGLVLIIAAGVLVLGSFAVLDDAASGFERQRVQVVALLEPAATALDHAATSAANAGASLGATRDAAARAATLTARLAESFEGLAALSSFEVLGARPFGTLAGQFAAVGSEARLVSTDLATAADTMGTNVSDSQAVASDLRALATRLQTLRAGLGVSSGTDTSSGTGSLQIDTARLVLLGLLAWLAVPALVSLWFGARLLRVRPG
ncbi:MAG TPA: hypothetical protein VIF63_01110 [Candidatus Limnocylindrales bacterium]